MKNAASFGPASGQFKSMLNQRVEALQRQQGNVIATRQSLIGAIFSSFFRLLILLAVAEVAIIWLVADTQDLHGQPWGYVLRYAIWLGIGETPFYQALDEFLWTNQNVLPFLLPVVWTAALTLYFLPSINAARSRTIARFVVYPLNLVAGWSGLGWLVALAISFVGGRASTQMRPAPRGQPARAGRSMLPSSGSASVKSARPGPVRTAVRREPAIVRRGSSQSWVRPR